MSVAERVESSTSGVADAIRRALVELDEQRAALAAALAVVDGNGHGPPKVAAKRKRAKAANGKAKPGERHRQIVEYVSHKPGCTAKEIATTLGINDLQVYGIVSRAEKKGELISKRRPGAQFRIYPVKHPAR